MTEAYDGRQVVGMDLHRRRSVLVRMTMDGRKLETVQIGNSPAALRAVLARCGKNPLVVLEATYGWYWAADVLAGAGAEVRLASPHLSITAARSAAICAIPTATSSRSARSSQDPATERALDDPRQADNPGGHPTTSRD
jgi:hypothetical protein